MTRRTPLEQAERNAQAAAAIYSNQNLSDESKDRLIGKLAQSDPVAANALREMSEILGPLKGKDRLRALKRAKKILHKKERELHAEKQVITDAKARISRAHQAVAEMDPWLKGPLQIQRADHSMMPKLRASFWDDEVYCLSAIKEDPMAILAKFEDTWETASNFVVEHDWAAAFKGAGDFDLGEFKLPDDICVFEFRISGHMVVVTAFVDEPTGVLCIMPTMKFRTGWIIKGTMGMRSDGAIGSWKSNNGNAMNYMSDTGAFTVLGEENPDLPLARVITAQIRAISIALDAEVATTNKVTRVTHLSNRARPGRKMESYSYHVVSLARRSRVELAPSDPNAAPGPRKRLHFRRGHWRHFEKSKTWIRWCLVGDPDLGFVDKHYKL